MNRTYPSKLILFGEYSVVLGSQVLGMPRHNRYGYWTDRLEANSVMKRGFIPYLKEHCSNFLDEQKINDIKTAKLHYGSTIKRGYGTGSSGALSAAVYDYCAISAAGEMKLLQSQLALIESFFHGQSSGFDPLISYMDSPILRTKEGRYETCDLSQDLLMDDWKLYLLDSGQKRTVKGLVPRFVSWHEDYPDRYNRLNDINNELIDLFLEGSQIQSLISQLSSFQLTYMKPMILDQLVSYWQEGLDTSRYYLKICGSGGGGYYMIYSADPSIHDLFNGYQLVPIDLS